MLLAWSDNEFLQRVLVDLDSETEYTVGANGPNAMPAALPPTSRYTYAVELSADEAIAAGAKSVNFSQPLLNYVENFLGFSVGTIVPSGFYDRAKAAWIPSADGRVIKITGNNAGLAVVDSVGTRKGNSTQQAKYSGLGDAGQAASGRRRPTVCAVVMQIPGSIARQCGAGEQTSGRLAEADASRPRRAMAARAEA